MSRRLYVGSLAWATTSDDLRSAFEEVGEVEDAVVLMNNETGRSRGFGFVTMKNDADGDAAIERFHQNEAIGGRKLIVNDARPQERNNGGSFRPRREGGYDRPARQDDRHQSDMADSGASEQEDDMAEAA